jgi:hypothetical protein
MNPEKSPESENLVSLVEQSHEFRRQGEELLSSSELPQVLGKYGELKFVGSYPAELMMNGDIDIHVVREKAFSKQEVLDAFNDIASHTHFISYYIGDWNGTNIHPEFPDGYYVGMKTKFADRNWKIDTWFISYDEQAKRDQEKIDITRTPLSEKQRESILQFKKFRNDNNVGISGQKIYEIVINEGITELEDFKERLKRK